MKSFLPVCRDLDSDKVTRRQGRVGAALGRPSEQACRVTGLSVSSATLLCGFCPLKCSVPKSLFLCYCEYSLWSLGSLRRCPGRMLSAVIVPPS